VTVDLDPVSMKLTCGLIEQACFSGCDADKPDDPRDDACDLSRCKFKWSQVKPTGLPDKAIRLDPAALSSDPIQVTLRFAPDEAACGHKEEACTLRGKVAVAEVTSEPYSACYQQNGQLGYRGTAGVNVVDVVGHVLAEEPAIRIWNPRDGTELAQEGEGE